MYTLKPNLEAVLCDINKKCININKYRQIYTLHCHELRRSLFDSLRRKKPFGDLFNGFRMAGSYGDNLKVTKPDEFDMDFLIEFPEWKRIEVYKDHKMPGNVQLDFTNVIKKIRNEKQHSRTYRYMQEWLDRKHYLILTKIQSYFQSCFSKALKDVEHLEEYRHIKLTYKRQGPAHTIYVYQNRKYFQYSIDFVPVIRLGAKQSIRPMLDGDLWEAIPKPISTKGHVSTSLRSSYYHKEQQLIENKQNLKNALRLMKRFRNVHPNISGIKSYYIKTIFLLKTEKSKGTHYWRRPLAQIIINMFKSMESHLRNRNLPYYWDRSLNLLQTIPAAQFPEFLKCFVKARKSLERAYGNLNQINQKRIYKDIFGCRSQSMLRELKVRDQFEGANECAEVFACATYTLIS
ncbi:cyclic GMP-AMP synthase-like receptor isoform X2 [Haematobia irritans]|uniref:cyclic GMP-AMP synthase-like receptor isoform X2 n=1 Tax=Haematobia irritans TaxID=7368 RepID=UPI003F501C8F